VDAVAEGNVIGRIAGDVEPLGDNVSGEKSSSVSLPTTLLSLQQATPLDDYAGRVSTHDPAVTLIAPPV